MYSGRKMHVDGPLLMGVLALCVLGLVLIFSASGENWNLMWRQGIRLLLSLGVMLAAAQIPPEVVRPSDTQWRPIWQFRPQAKLV